MSEVTQADRDAAALVYKALLHSTDMRAINAKLGNMDDLDTVQAFASHRIATEQRVLAEVVAWLRGGFVQDRHPEDAAFARHIATAIETGAWKQ